MMWIFAVVVKLLRFLLIGIPSLLLLLICWPIINRAMYEADCREE